MDTYRRKNTPDSTPRVEAAELTRDNAEELAELVDGDIVQEQNAENASEMVPGINFDSFEGRVRLSLGDYLVKDFEGNYYRRQGFLFVAKYELEAQRPMEEPLDDSAREQLFVVEDSGQPAEGLTTEADMAPSGTPAEGESTQSAVFGKHEGPREI